MKLTWYSIANGQFTISPYFFSAAVPITPFEQIPSMNDLGVVVIGRNEGERLRRCLNSVVARGYAVVYVDSGSTDGSTELARELGGDLVDLDLSQPFTMARARNTGFSRLLALDPDVRFVQFVDGDCELIDGWLEHAKSVIERRSEVAVVCGRIRERCRDKSIYNRLADLDWDLPVGVVKYCGGITLTRVEAFHQVGGFKPDLIAGEDPELCIRLRQRGWTILCIDAEMALHDIAMTRFSQWWKRCIRTGHAFAEGAALHGKLPEQHFVRQTRSILGWGGALPLVVCILALPTGGVSFILSSFYLLLYWRVYRYGLHRGWSLADARLFAFSCVLAKFPMLIGLITYWFRRITHRSKQLIEYKGPTENAGLRRETSSI
jgi:GT2 family glycosyltransferase